MGYTNYWTPINENSVDKDFYKDAEKIIDYAIKVKCIPLTNGDGETLIKTAKEAYEGKDICLNGYGEESHESFYLSFNGEWEFCKTAREPYDQVVKAILILAEEYGLLGEPFTFDGDRREAEFRQGKKLHDEALKSEPPTLTPNEITERKCLYAELTRLQNKLFDLSQDTESEFCEKVYNHLNDAVERELKNLYGKY